MPWLTAIIIIPLFGALSMYIVPEGGIIQARIHAVLAAGLTLVLSAVMLGHFDRSSGAPQFVEHAGWATSVGLDWSV
jgi:NADH-quinone oxidoreductase subunit M